MSLKLYQKAFCRILKDQESLGGSRVSWRLQFFPVDLRGLKGQGNFESLVELVGLDRSYLQHLHFVTCNAYTF